MDAARVTLVLVLLHCGLVPGIYSQASVPKPASFSAVVARSLRAVSQGRGQPRSAPAEPDTVSSDGRLSTTQLAGGDLTPASVSGSGPHLGRMLRALLPDGAPSKSPALYSGESKGAGGQGQGSEPARSPTGDSVPGAGGTPLPHQFGTYWRALNGFLGDSEPGESGTEDTDMERLFGQQGSSGDRNGSTRKRGAPFPRWTRSQGSTSAEQQHSKTTEKQNGPPKMQTSPELKTKIDDKMQANPELKQTTDDETERSYTMVPARDHRATTLRPGRMNTSELQKKSTELYFDGPVEQHNIPTTSSENSDKMAANLQEGSASVANSLSEQPKEHRTRTGPVWPSWHRPNRSFSTVTQQSSDRNGAINNGTFGRLMAAARNSSGAAPSIRIMKRLLASRQAGAGRNISTTSSSSSSGNSSDSNNSRNGNRQRFSFRTVARLLASRRGAASGIRVSGSSSSDGDKDSAALGRIPGTMGHQLRNNSARNATSETADKSTDRDEGGRLGRRPGRLSHRLWSRLGSRAAASNDSGRALDQNGDPRPGVWGDSASSLLAGLLTPGRMIDAMSEVVGRVSSQLTDRLLGRLTAPLQTVTGRAGSTLSRLPKILEPIEQLMVGELFESPRPSTADLPESELERLQRQLGYSESSERATVAEVARLRRRLKDQRLAGRAHWSVSAAERNGDMMAHIWTMMP